MKTNIISYCLIFLALIQFSCSETLQRRYDQRHGTTSSSDRYGNDDRDRSRTSPTTTGKDAYRRDYDKMMEEDVKSNYPKADYNQKLVTQYEEMDKMGELVLYELDILENRWNALTDDYKNANSSEKESIASQLDRITDDRLVLYKAYTNIYKNGKTNWLVVKPEVENTLRSVRRVSEK
ncbi:hypothetical protein [Dyadobacter luticola]|uniref:Uncharacterized protein n=1 Tax=Dyadobacter luticola TaxID=1979387 RepID=A0A5R9KTD0_9BACT|nr:hypothetical protein [Dyadobacter luticola]TLU99463.1 hypothetical protein FEN17_23180 [Dyadobacter luticola]